MTAGIGIAIRDIRGLRTQQEFADLLGVSRITVARWETDEALPAFRHARQLVAHGLDEAMYLRAARPVPAGEVA
jgi:transcriptional regulator with XRE-family HTH domain